MKNNIIIKICLIFTLFTSLLLTNEVNCIEPVDPAADFASTDFEINVSGFSPVSKVPDDYGFGTDTLAGKADSLLLTIIEMLMVAMGVMSLLVISIGAGYMIFYNGKEDFLTKGRNMIYTGFLALVIALSSYYIINLVRYILYD